MGVSRRLRFKVYPKFYVCTFKRKEKPEIFPYLADLIALRVGLFSPIFMFLSTFSQKTTIISSMGRKFSRISVSLIINQSQDFSTDLPVILSAMPLQGTMGRTALSNNTKFYIIVIFKADIVSWITCIYGNLNTYWF